jgi:putative ATPase
VITLDRLTEEDISAILDLALNDEQRGLGALNFELAGEARDHIIRIADGDARVALNSLEVVGSLVISKQTSDNLTPALKISLKDLEAALQEKALIYDKDGEEHYNIISALHKSLRGSDPDAALYWLARMLASGEDPFYIARRMVRFASEDIGNADPNALSLAMSAMEAFRFLGHPEGELALAQAAVYLATAPKSNSIYSAFGKANAAIKKTGALPVPFHIRNAPTKLMKDLGYGKNYKYAHNYEDAIVPQEYLPDKLKGQHFYLPTTRGFERTIKERLDKWRQLIQKSKTAQDNMD